MTHANSSPDTFSRVRYVALALVTIVLGLLVHLRGTALGPRAQDATGDALWAMMIVWWLSALAPAVRRVARGAIAFGVCAGVELSQLYHGSTIDAIRATTVGHLVLGSGFDPRDLAAYAIGVAGALLLDVGFFRETALTTRRESNGQTDG
ncbi:MAG TPA: DUF2809 domain-containing protein [Gemmatimonadaceae bacterium]